MLGGGTTTTSFAFGAAPTASFSFGANKTNTTFSFGQPQSSTGFTATQPSTGATATPASTAAAATATTQASAPTSTSGAPSSSMNYRLLEESVNQWEVELEELERDFIIQATQVNARDRLVWQSAERVAELNVELECAQLDQQRLEHELDYVAAQQAELERLLAPLESGMRTAPALSVQQHADLEREHTYHLAANINSQLNCVSRDIGDCVEQLNTASASSAQDEPVKQCKGTPNVKGDERKLTGAKLEQISQVMSAHMDALTWIQRHSDQMKQKLQDLERSCKQRAEPLLKH